VAIFSSWLVVKMGLLHAKVIVPVLLVDVVVYFILPTSYLVHFTNAFLYTSMLIWCNTLKASWDISFGIWIVVNVIDLW
jgi:hypothetical protein